MKTRTHQRFKWQSVEEMHLYSTLWNSKMEFVLDECTCLETMLKDKVFFFNESHLTKKAYGLIAKIKTIHQEASGLLIKINNHRNKLRIMFNSTESFDSTWAYKHEHRKLLIKLNELLGDFKLMKTGILRTVCDAMKFHKQRRIA
ncbi:hypothetical protein [Christiangramia salexigens]|uniref:Uncharacterized protein n=1 Tax=Christiangramia salexigens TaxID=1913577 RepID=A0A1L3J304_9FLAO|nr:hypothetical protein [Christiangramia salexigens]APG59496.1 hypothetical protein LPB144_03310 [Christiangramia salexigens]